jgi:hypothetical protein
LQVDDMPVNADQQQPRHARRPLAVVNRTVLAILRSPLHGLLDAGMCELRYRGRRTGRTVALPVMYAVHGNDVVVLVGDAPDKRWWRNFTRPGPVEIRRGRQRLAGVGRIVASTEAGYGEAWQAYFNRHHVDSQPGDRLLVVTLTGAQPTSR